MFGERGKHIIRAGTLTVDTGTTGVIDAVNDRAVCRCEDLLNLTVLATSPTPSTTVTLVFEVSFDGIGWSTAGANATISNFAAANTSYPLAQSDTHGMPLPVHDARVTCTVFTGAGSYTFAVVGYQRQGYA